jgi:hypothetical protein
LLGTALASLGEERHPALSSMTLSGMGPSLAVEGATTRAVFEAYVEEALAPSLHPGQVVVMDNLTAHKGERVRELIEERGRELVFLPPYSPDFNTIEQAFRGGQGNATQSRGTHERSADRSDRQGALCGDGHGRFGVLRALRLPGNGPTAMTAALGPEGSTHVVVLDGYAGSWIHRLGLGCLL